MGEDVFITFFLSLCPGVFSFLFLTIHKLVNNSLRLIFMVDGGDGGSKKFPSFSKSIKNSVTSIHGLFMDRYTHTTQSRGR